MFENIFEKRNKKVTSLLKLTDCLGRSLRENVALFSVDDAEDKVIFVTENNRVISGNYKIDNDISLTNIEVVDSDAYEDETKFNSLVEDQISNFIGSIHENNYSKSDNEFKDLLSLWGTRLKFDNVKASIQEKTLKFSENKNIIKSTSFEKLKEITPALVEFLKENKDTIYSVKEIKNAVKLADVVSEAFNFPYLSYEDLVENKDYIIKDGSNDSIYEIICQQELLKKELLESKSHFEYLWTTNENIQKLSSLIFESDEDVIVSTLSQTLAEIPYFSLATKKQLRTTIKNSLNLQESVVTEVEIKTFASKLFEYKKPVKDLLISMLSEKYGVNALNLKEPPTFKSLLNTEVVLFEVLSKLSKKGSVQKEVLSEVAAMLRLKDGVQSIDVNNYIQTIFEEAGYEDYHDSKFLNTKLNFNDTLSENTSIEDLVTLIKKNVSDLKVDVSDEEIIERVEKVVSKPATDAALKSAKEKDAEDADGEIAQAEQEAEIEAETAEEEAAKEEDVGEEGEEDEGGDEDEEPPVTISKEEMLGSIADLEEILKSLSPSDENDE